MRDSLPGPKHLPLGPSCNIEDYISTWDWRDKYPNYIRQNICIDIYWNYNILYNQVTVNYVESDPGECVTLRIWLRIRNSVHVLDVFLYVPITLDKSLNLSGQHFPHPWNGCVQFDLKDLFKILNAINHGIDQIIISQELESSQRKILWTTVSWG